MHVLFLHKFFECNRAEIRYDVAFFECNRAEIRYDVAQEQMEREHLV